MHKPRPSLHFVLCLAALAALPSTTAATETDVDTALATHITPPTEQTLGQGQSALWTLPLVATQYQPAQAAPALQAALQAQTEGRFIDALLRLDEEDARTTTASAESRLLRASLHLQGRQSQPTIAQLAPLLADPQHAADAHALTAMALLQLGQMQAALTSAETALARRDALLPRMASSYALQAAGRLDAARKTLTDFNARRPPVATALAREAELALVINQLPAAQQLIHQALSIDATHPYVIAVNGLVALIDGRASEAKTTFTSALSIDPHDAKALFGLGLAEIRLGNFAAGHKKLQAAHAADPGNALILTYLGRSQQHQGQPDAARASWRLARQADPRDPMPWLYQAALELAEQQPQAARASLREADSRLNQRAVYRGENLLQEDTRQLQAHLAEAQRQMGLEALAFQTLATPVGAGNSTQLRNQGDVLQGQRFAEMARRSLLLQSQFDARPGTLPAALDLYGDGNGMTGAASPQRGFIGSLGASHTSYNHYDELFAPRAQAEFNLHTGSRNTTGIDARAGIGNDRLGLSLAHMQFSSDGYAPFENLDNRALDTTVQWRPTDDSQMFLSRQTFDSDWGAVFYPAQPWLTQTWLADSSQVKRLGLRQRLDSDFFGALTQGRHEIRVLLSRQDTETRDGSSYPYTGDSYMRSTELQLRHDTTGQAVQWGLQQLHGNLDFFWDDGSTNQYALAARHVYAAWQKTLLPAWQIETHLGWGQFDSRSLTSNNPLRLQRWLPHLGVVWTPDAASHVRLASWRGMAMPTPGNASLAPASLAGIVLQRPGDIRSSGILVRALALAYDRQLTPDWLLMAEAVQRRRDLPINTLDYTGGPPIPSTLYYRNDDATLALHWQPHTSPWSAKLSQSYEKLTNDRRSDALDSVSTQTLHSSQLDLRWFATARWTLNLQLSHNRLSGTQSSTDMTTWNTIYPPYRDRYNQLDAQLNWQPAPGSQLTAGVRNASDRRTLYADIDALNPRHAKGRMLYAKVRLNW
jgi:tetratricopeptide (TPR) repeat protein